MDGKIKFDLIVTIVDKGHSDKVISASKKAGAEGGTIIMGRETDVHEHARLFDVTIEPEKEVVLTIIDRRRSEEVLSAIIEAADLNLPGKGNAFILEIGKVAGINHNLKDT